MPVVETVETVERSTPIAAAPPAVQLRDISKSFGEVRALDHVEFSIDAGRVSALLGENGAGKTTLMQLLCGLLTPDRGEIFIEGRPARLRGPADAIAAGVGMVHQHFQLVPRLTVAENVLLGGVTPRLWLGRRAGHAEIAALAREHGLRVDPTAAIWQLSVGERQQVEILKVLRRGARYIILDEPTAVLTPSEIAPFFDTLRALAARGVAIAMVTHKLREVLEVADVVTVLRRGRVAASDVPVTGIDEAQLGRLILGTVPIPGAPGVATALPRGQPSRELADPVDHSGEVLPVARSTNPPRLRLRGISALGLRGGPSLDAVDLCLHPGEILGVAGVSGNGQRELAEVVVGLRLPSVGRVLLDDEDVTAWSVRRRLDWGVGFVPEDRKASGVASGLSVLHNLSLRRYRSPRHGSWVRWADLTDRARALIRDHDVRIGRLDQPAGQLSGGNMQKLILARELDAEPRVLVVAQPTRGLDLGASAMVRERLVDLARAGCAVLWISEDLEELFACSARIAVLFRGRAAGPFETPSISIDRVGALMLGQEVEQ